MRAISSENGDRLHEFVGDALLVEAAQRFDRMLRLRADAEGHEVVSALNAIPSLVAVHREIAPDDRR